MFPDQMSQNVVSEQGKHCYLELLKYDPVHDKTYKKTGVTSKDSCQPVHPLSTCIARVPIYPSG